MSSIKIQKREVDKESGKIIKEGSASVVDTIYDPSIVGHARHKVRERLGKVLYLSEDKKSGIFMSPTRGIVEYDSIMDSFTSVDKDDPRLPLDILFPEPEVHTTFGDSYLFLKASEKTGMINVIRSAFPNDKEYERVLAHIVHSVVKNGAKIDCDDFITKSFLSYFINDVPISSLGSDTQYFTMMGDDNVRLSYFKSFVKEMKKMHPDFGTATYVDSTPLPNSISNNPFRALCSHGTGECCQQTRLVLVLDQATGLPVWYDIIPGNLLDLSTIEFIMDDVKTSLGIEIKDMILDAGYAKESLIKKCAIGNEDNLSITVRCPAKKGYPHERLSKAIRPLFGNAKYEFDREGHPYFGKKFKETIFGCEMYAYVYVDKFNAMIHGLEWREKNPNEYSKLTDREKTWSSSMQYGFFILLSNNDKTPEEMLDDYFGRTQIESVFRSAKEYLDILPLSKWTDTTVRGKILSDIIATTSYLCFRKLINNRLQEKKKKNKDYKKMVHINKLFAASSSLQCIRDRTTKKIRIETPNKKVKDGYADVGIQVPNVISEAEFKKNILRL